MGRIRGAYSVAREHVSGVLGLHLLQAIALVDTPRPSALARLDGDGRLTALELVRDDDEVVAAAVAAGPADALAVDAPLHVPNARGQRDAERVLAWCDVAALPASRERLATVHGGLRGVELAPRLAQPGRPLLEALPDQVLRQLLWERDHAPGAPAIDLADYRAAWIGVRAPPFRPKGTGRARPDGILAAWRILAEAVDLGGWTPAPSSDDWVAIADAARIDAILSAYVALRWTRGAAVTIPTGPDLRLALPADANLAARVTATLDRLRGEGAIAI